MVGKLLPLYRSGYWVLEDVTSPVLPGPESGIESSSSDSPDAIDEEPAEPESGKQPRGDDEGSSCPGC